MINTHAKGGKFRHEVELWLQDAGFTTTVRGLGFAGDDIVAVRDLLALSIEAKNQRAIELARFVDQAVANAGLAIPVVVVHRKGRASVDDAYVVLPGAAFVQLITELLEPAP